MTRPLHLYRFLVDSPAARPDAIAVVEAGRALTYAALREATQRLAAHFRASLGTRPGAIALCASNSIEYVLSLLAGLASGRPVAEISPQESPERLAGVLSRLEPAALVTSLDPALFSGMGVRVFPADEITSLAASTPVPPAPVLEFDDDAFIVFTSGTTGLPKGVVLGHGNAIAVTESILDYLPLRDDDRYALVLPLYHTYGKSVLMTTLRAGATLVLDHGFADVRSFAARLESDRITAFAAVPYHAKLLLARGALAERDLRHLRWFTISGGPIGAADLEALAQQLPATGVIFMYGLTESTTRAFALRPEWRAAKPGSVGRPIRDVRVRIVNERLEDLPPGAEGEVLLAGPNIMHGYWGEPEASARVLVDGWLRTGDIGRLDEDGFLYLGGRKSDLIKCAGERISAQEIEDVISQHPAVAEVAVRGVSHPFLGEEPVAWVVPRGEGIDPSDLSAHCAARLVSYKIPRAWHFRAELPRTPSGKVQKHRLTADID